MTTGRLPSVEGGIQPTIVDAKGDLITATAADTPARIGVGSNGQLLSANSSTSTGLEWVAAPSSGGMTSLASGSIAASTTGIDITSISNTYNELVLYITNASTAAAANIAIRVNNNTSADYSRMYYSQLSSSVIQTSSGATSLIYVDNFSATQAGQTAVISFPNYKNTTGMKLIQALASYTNEYMFFTSGLVKATAAIDRITIISSSTFDGGTYELFGVK